MDQLENDMTNEDDNKINKRNHSNNSEENNENQKKKMYKRNNKNHILSNSGSDTDDDSKNTNKILNSTPADIQTNWMVPETPDQPRMVRQQSDNQNYIPTSRNRFAPLAEQTNDPKSSGSSQQEPKQKLSIIDETNHSVQQKGQE